MENVLLIILLLLALTLIGVVLLQRSEGGGLGMGGGGGGGGGGVMSSRGAATALSKLTWVLGITFLGASLALTIISAQNTADSTVTDLISTPAQDATDGESAPAAPAVPGTPDVSDMMPSSEPAGNAPLAPPRAD